MRNPLITALTALGLGGGAYLLWRRLASGTMQSAPSASSLSPEFQPEAVSIDVPAAKAAAHKGARPIIEQAFQVALKRAGSLDEVQYVQAVASLETSYGRGWNETRCPGGNAANNWGAVQSKGDGFPCEDSYPDGTKYKQNFKVYASPVEGGADVVRHVLVHRPKTASALNERGATIYRASYAMRREVYYGGFCPKAVARYGSGIAKPSVATPDRDEGTQACAREAIELHAKTVNTKIREIASVLGEPAMPLGTFEDADSWYRKQYGA